MLVTLQGQVLAVDDSAYRLPPSDTLSYVVSSMLSFVDTVPRYRIRIVDKYLTVEDRNYIQFFVGDTRVVDTLGDNWRQLDKITGLMRQIVEQQEFWGRYHHADGGIVSGRSLRFQRPAFARTGRGAETLPCPPIRQKHRHDAYRAVGGRRLAGIDAAHSHGREIENRDAILALTRGEKESRPAGAGHPAAVPERVCLYPFGDLPAAAGREFPLQSASQRDGKGHDSHHGVGYDLCPRRVELLQKRKYAKALYILNDYNDRNTVVAHLSLDHNERAMELLATMPKMP